MTRFLKPRLRALAVLVAMLVAVQPRAAPAEDWQTLNGGQITEALTAGPLRYDTGARQIFYPDGRTLYTAGAGESWGRWWADSDRYCSTWPPSEQPTCYAVARRDRQIRFVGARGDETIGTRAAAD